MDGLSHEPMRAPVTRIGQALTRSLISGSILIATGRTTAALNADTNRYL